MCKGSNVQSILYHLCSLAPLRNSECRAERGRSFASCASTGSTWCLGSRGASPANCSSLLALSRAGAASHDYTNCPACRSWLCWIGTLDLRACSPLWSRTTASVARSSRDQTCIPDHTQSPQFGTLFASFQIRIETRKAMLDLGVILEYSNSRAFRNIYFLRIIGWSGALRPDPYTYSRRRSGATALLFLQHGSSSSSASLSLGISVPSRPCLCGRLSAQSQVHPWWTAVFVL